ncbi:MAG: hypothetical protein COB71_00180 [Thiotrichales bacterium]|nr:MAG: hypothetical protein COB71_00180 [Thiotrichales bacterium]
MMTKERVYELDRLVSEAIIDCEKLDDLVDSHILEFWRGAKMIVDELKIEMGTVDTVCPIGNPLRDVI